MEPRPSPYSSLIPPSPVLTPSIGVLRWIRAYEVTEALLIDAGVTVFQNLFMIAGFLSLIAILPALLMKPEGADEGNGFI